MPFLLAIALMLFSAMVLLAVVLSSPATGGAFMLFVFACMAYSRWCRHLDRKERSWRK